MRLTTAEAERFYRVWVPVLHYVNERLQLVPSFPAKWQINKPLPTAAAVKLRDALWKDDSVRERFITENPAKFTPEDLALVESWKHRRAGNFFIFRHLKKYSVFLSEESPSRAYGVVGLLSTIEEVVGPYLPVYVQAVLLPYEDRIMYDGLIAGYPVMFGSGIRGDLNDTYRAIQEREGIITALLPSARFVSRAEAPPKVRARNKKILTAFQKDLGRAGLSLKMMVEHVSNIETFAEKQLLRQSRPRGLLDLTTEDIQGYLKAGGNPVSIKRFVQFLRNTARMEFEKAEDLLAMLKTKRR
jgi:hypothetical protein